MVLVQFVSKKVTRHYHFQLILSHSIADDAKRQDKMKQAKIQTDLW